MTKTAFAVGAHPDDIEFLMSGTLMLLGEAGYELHYMNVANGCLGTTRYDTPTIVAMRRQEAREAAASIGAVYHESICADLDIFYDRETLAQVASVMRDVAPEIVLTHSPVDYMEDHTNTCRLVVTAAFSRGMPNFPVVPARPPVMQPTAVYHAQPYSNRDPLRRLVLPELFVDVTDREDAKVAMLARHVSQKQWLDESQGLDSYLQTLRDLDAEVGRMSGRWAYAEGWRRHLHLGFGVAAFDPLGDVLADRIAEVPP
ncbi:MAG: PIG-L family deacetylase [Pirellulaceae bacterium]|jgi:LmbE family N-acetylglucosaminyl deacetylase|nr:PIG-L family deacetylase [Pirellulaceae bacterium]